MQSLSDFAPTLIAIQVGTCIASTVMYGKVSIADML